MTLPLFDTGPDRRARPVTLIRLAGELARFAGGVGLVAVEGEVHRPTTSKGGWIFFTLRDRAAQMDVKVPRVHAKRCRAVGGERVCVVGVLDWTADRGQLHLKAEEVTPVGAGAIAALVAETRRRLGAAGLLDRPRRGLPLLPSCIGVVCGAEAAVRKDIEAVVADRFPGYPVHFEETTVSGPGAAVSIIEALQRVAARPGVDVVIVARGGGDATSLLPWSDEEVCRAVAGCAVPVVSAIGHHGDRPLCDEVADLRCPTPSIAAGAVVPDRLGLDGRIDADLQRAAGALGERLATAGRALAAVDTARALDAGMVAAVTRLETSARRWRDAHPRRQLEACRHRLAATDWRRPTGELLGRAAGRLEAGRRHLSALDPQRVLERGFAVATGPDGTVVRSAAAVAPGDEVAVRVAVGSFRARVVGGATAAGSGQDPPDHLTAERRVRP
jgi:exodeoxyribonuclease VII large subunit